MGDEEEDRSFEPMPPPVPGTAKKSKSCETGIEPKEANADTSWKLVAALGVGASESSSWAKERGDCSVELLLLPEASSWKSDEFGSDADDDGDVVVVVVLALLVLLLLFC